jgi:RNA polymerase sigma factor (sigma-70 family)
VNPTDNELLARCFSKDDPDAFAELVRRHQSSVRGFLRRLTRGDHAQSDDLAQEAFIHAYRGLGGFRGGSRFRTWILGIAYNLHRNERRRSAAWTRAEPEAPEPSGDGALQDLRQDLASALRALPCDEQVALELQINQEMTHEDIAATTGWPLGTVKTHLLRGKERLRGRLAAWRPVP